VFWEARSISRSPSLAYYYHGRVCALRDMLDRAEASYRAGLKHNPLHYRCLTGLFDLLTVLPGGARDAEAYEVARRLFETFPVSARRLEAILRLVVRTRSFGAMDALGQLYDAVEARTPGLTRVMVAALVVSGIHYLMTPPPHPNYPIELFQRAITLSGRSSAVLREVITKLVDHGRHRDAQEFLRQFPAEVQRGADYQLMEFLVFSASGFAPRVVEHGRRLLHEGIDDPLLYEILIDRSIQVGHRDGADGLIYDAVKRYPELREKLFKRLSG
jgi:hypothetical protein